MATNPITKFTLKEWVRHPTTILLIVVSLAAWTLGGLYVASVKGQKDEAVKRADKYEDQVFKYTNTILFKEATEKELKEVIRSKEKLIDSLKGGTKND